jgi:hypothetical protein
MIRRSPRWEGSPGCTATYRAVVICVLMRHHHPRRGRVCSALATFLNRGRFNRVPERTNEFQNMIGLLTALMREDESMKVTSPAMVTDKATGSPREVDVTVETHVAGHKVVVGIECRAQGRPQTVEWVEAMYGKHAHLETDARALVLVSSTGFTRDALTLAKFLGVEAITPGQATPAFVGKVVNNLTSLWAQVADLQPDRMQLWVQWPEGDTQVVDASPEMGIYLPDGTLVCDAKTLRDVVMSKFDMNNDVFHGATGEETFFEFGQEHPMLGDAPLCLLPRTRVTVKF